MESARSKEASEKSQLLQPPHRAQHLPTADGHRSWKQPQAPEVLTQMGPWVIFPASSSGQFREKTIQSGGEEGKKEEGKERRGMR